MLHAVVVPPNIKHVSILVCVWGEIFLGFFFTFLIIIFFSLSLVSPASYLYFAIINPTSRPRFPLVSPLLKSKIHSALPVSACDRQPFSPTTNGRHWVSERHFLQNLLIRPIVYSHTQHCFNIVVNMTSIYTPID